MDTFFTLLKKSLVATVFIIFAFVAVYIPQPYNNVSEAEAVLATEATQATIIANLVSLNASNSAVAGFDSGTSISTIADWGKENVLDTLGWIAAKKALSTIVSDLIDWINNGFKNRPGFVQDIGGFLRDTADQEIGEYLQNLTAVGSFICSPFRLSVRISVDLQYRRGTQPAPTCTLSGIVDNIEGFIDGSFEEGGWKGWFALTSTPQSNTPYGAALTAQAGARAAIINAQGEEIKLLDFGAGFFSSKKCNDVDGKEVCNVITPGQTISNALSFNLDSGRQTLIAADEIDELITALLSQLANKALTGGAGLLGLTEDGASPGYTGSYLDQLIAESNGEFNYEEGSLLMNNTLDTQIDYLNLAIESLSTFQAYLANPRNSNPAKKAPHFTAIDEAKDIIRDLMGSFPKPGVAASDSVIGELKEVIDRYEDPTATDDDRLDMVREFSSLIYYTEQDINDTIRDWEHLEANQGASGEINSAIDNFDFKKIKELMDDTLDIQIEMFELATEMETRSQYVISPPELLGIDNTSDQVTDPAILALFQDASDKARVIIEKTRGSFPPPAKMNSDGNIVSDSDSGYIYEMRELRSLWGHSLTSKADKLNLAHEFSEYRGQLYSQTNLNQAISNWAETLSEAETLSKL